VLFGLTNDKGRKSKTIVNAFKSGERCSSTKKIKDYIKLFLHEKIKDYIKISSEMSICAIVHILKSST